MEHTGTEEQRATSSRSRGFDYSLDYATLDLRSHPELYRVGRGEQGVLLVQPYKAEILRRHGHGSQVFANGLHPDGRSPRSVRRSQGKIIDMRLHVRGVSLSWFPFHHEG